MYSVVSTSAVDGC